MGYFCAVVKAMFHTFLCAILMLNSMVYSVIQGSYELNKAYIVQNFCVNKDKPMMNCDGKCYLAQKMKAQKEKQDANSTHKFNTDFGIYIAAPALEQFSSTSGIPFHKPTIVYAESFSAFPCKEISKPPKA